MNYGTRSKYKNLIIIGNGFDIWQDVASSFEQFRKYYFDHIGEVSKSLGVGEYKIKDEAGQEKTVNPVELIYGHALGNEKLPDEFFWNFETAIDKIDDQKISLYFGRSDRGIEDLHKAVKDAQAVLRKLFCDWVQKFNFPEHKTVSVFPDDCYFINFNYTDTLEKRFGISAKDVYHIHGSVHNPDSIVFGHSTHPETAFDELINRQFIQPVEVGNKLPRLKGLYAVEDILYKTDKHIMDRIDSLCLAMYKRGVHIEDFENIFVLGHSLGDQDIEYFEFIDRATRCGCDYNELSAVGQMDPVMVAIILSGSEFAEDLLFNYMMLNLEYATHHRERVWKNAENLFPQFEEWDKMHCREYDFEAAEHAVRQRFLLEQAGRTRKILEAMAKEANDDVPEGCQSVLDLADYLDCGHAPRKKNPVWHVTYFKPEDKTRITGVMKLLRQKRYKLYPSIDECISKNFKN